MIRLLTGRARIGLVVAAMAVAVAMGAFAQTTEPAIESVPASDQPAALNSSPTGDENSTDKDTSVQSDPPVGPTPAAAAEVEIQRRFNELQRELLDDRADYIDRWLIAVTIVLAFFGILGFKRFREAEARKSVEAAKRYEADAKDHAERIEALQGNAVADVQRIRDLMTAEVAAQNPAEANQAVKDARENPEASLTDKAITDAVSLQQQGKRDAAIEKWRAIAHVVEGSDNDLAARAWFSVGYLAMDEDPKGSVLANDRAIRLKPDYARAYNNRGAAKHELGRHEDAMADYNEAIRLKPDYAEAYRNRSSAKGSLGRHEDAMADCTEAIRLKPDDARAYNNRGVAKRNLEQYEDAIADYNEAIRLKPDYARAYNNRGAAKHELGRHEDAMADYDESLRLKPDYAEAYRNRGAAKGSLGQHEDAIADCAEALRLKPDDAVAYNNRGVAKGLLGQYEDAITDCAEAVRLKPGYAVAYNNRGAAKAALDLKDEARKDFEIALELAQKANDAKIVAQAEQLLRDLDAAEGS